MSSYSPDRVYFRYRDDAIAYLENPCWETYSKCIPPYENNNGVYSQNPELKLAAYDCIFISLKDYEQSNPAP